MQKINFFWFRRDLRLTDNAGLYHALKSKNPVVPLFIFDENILGDLKDKSDARVSFIHQALETLNGELKNNASSLLVKYGDPLKIWKELTKSFEIESVYTNHDYEPYAINRDDQVAALLQKTGITFHSSKDQVIFEKKEIVKADGLPYTVFTPYSRRWKEKLQTRIEAKGLSYFFKPYPTEKYFSNFQKDNKRKVLSLKEIGFTFSKLEFPSKDIKQAIIKEYSEKRDFPGIIGTSRLGIHFRFGTISIREKARKAEKLNGTYLNELIWRDFYAMILSNFPHVVVAPFRSKYKFIEWRNAPEDFQKWCEGQTGYPMVDAGMRELNKTGFMHNRVRMVVASFLTKHLLLDWRFGEAYFAEKLLDFDLASNNGGWQWAAGCGTDAAPYFRIFNPESQQKKFDKEFSYIKKWVPEFGTTDYVQPIVDHKMARERCLKTYKEGLAKSEKTK